MARPRTYTDEERKQRKLAQQKRWRAANPDRANAIRKKSNAKWKAKYPERAKEKKRLSDQRCRERVRRRHAEWRAANRDHMIAYQRAYRTKWKYGLTLEDYNTMLIAQGGCCAICKATSPSTKDAHWSIDHCHRTKTVRRLLCRTCNLGLGCFKDDIQLLQAALGYLKEFTS